MVREKKASYETKERTFLFTKDPLTIVKNTNNELQRTQPPEDPVNDEEISKETFNLDEQIEVAGNKNFSITVWRNRKIQINTHLIPLRFAQFLWFANGGVALPFFPLMLTHRGLKLSEFSFVFSLLFPFQLVVAYISGIIADKLGNAKPVLLFLMFCTIFSLISLLFFPDVKDKLCLEQATNISCLTVFNCSSYLENCEHAFSTNFFSAEKNNNSCYVFFISSENIVRNSSEILEYTFYSNGTKSCIVSLLSTEDVIATNTTKMLDEAFYLNSTISCNISFLSLGDNLVNNNSQIVKDAFYLNNTKIFCNEMCSRFDESTMSCPFASKNLSKIIYLALVVSFFSIYSTVFRFLDFAAVKLAKKHKSDFGKERIFALGGSFLATLLCNFVLNMNKSEVGGYYNNVYYFVVLLQVLSLVSSWKIRKFKLPPCLKLTKKTLMLFSDIEIVCMIIITFVAGTGFSFFTFYNLWFLNSLKASKIIIGLNIMTHSFYSFPIYATSEWWIRNLGQKAIVILSLLSYSISGIGYSFLYYPWLSLIIDATKGFYFHLFWVSAVTHCEKISPMGFTATVTAVIGTVHFGIGRSFSIPVGGYLISRFGARETFRILAGVFLVTAILYSLFLYLRYWYCKRSRKKGTDPEETKNMTEVEA